MADEIVRREGEDLPQAAMEAMRVPSAEELGFASAENTALPLAGLAALGVAFQPLAGILQSFAGGAGQSGLYYVDTNGKTMFARKAGPVYIGSLQTAEGKVGGGQASLHQLRCDPTMLFLAAALMNIEKKLDDIRAAQQEIMDYLERKELAQLRGSLHTLSEVFENYKYNWNNETYKTNKHILVQAIKNEAEQSILLYQEQAGKALKRRTAFHGDREVTQAVERLRTQFQGYQLALYLYAFAAFLEVLLLENYGSDYLGAVTGQIEAYSNEYRVLYTSCYDALRSYADSSLHSVLRERFADISKAVGETIAKAPLISASQLDENLIETGEDLKARGEKKTTAAMKHFVEMQSAVVRPFVENIQMLDRLYNKTTGFFVDGENLYLRTAAD